MSTSLGGYQRTQEPPSTASSLLLSLKHTGYARVVDTDQLKSQVVPYLCQGPDGKWVDTRYRFRRGTHVRVIAGTWRGQLAVIESLVAPGYHTNGLDGGAGYRVTLDSGKSVVVSCEWVSRLW